MLLANMKSLHDTALAKWVLLQKHASSHWQGMEDITGTDSQFRSVSPFVGSDINTIFVQIHYKPQSVCLSIVELLPIATTSVAMSRCCDQFDKNGVHRKCATLRTFCFMQKNKFAL